MWAAELQRQSCTNEDPQQMVASDQFHRTAAEARDIQPTPSLWTHLCICSYTLGSEIDSHLPRNRYTIIHIRDSTFSGRATIPSEIVK